MPPVVPEPPEELAALEPVEPEPLVPVPEPVKISVPVLEPVAALDPAELYAPAELAAELFLPNWPLICVRRQPVMRGATVAARRHPWRHRRTRWGRRSVARLMEATMVFAGGLRQWLAAAERIAACQPLGRPGESPNARPPHRPRPGTVGARGG